MAGSGNTFSASIDKWKNKTIEAIEMVLKASAQDMANAMVKTVPEGGRMRVDTGFLRNSLVASTAEMPKIDPAAKPDPEAEAGSYPAPDVSMVILGWGRGQTLYLGFTAAYAGHREYGARGAPPDGFVRMNVKTWPLIVHRNAVKLGVK